MQRTSPGAFCDLGGGDPSERRRRQIAGRKSEIRMIQHIGGGAFQLEVALLPDVKPLLQFGCKRLGSRPEQLAWTRVAEAADIVFGRAEGRSVKSVEDAALLRWNIAIAGAVIVRPIIGTRVDIGAAGIRDAARYGSEERASLKHQDA